MRLIHHNICAAVLFESFLSSKRRTMSENKLLVCPYDEAHKVKASRMQLHITRCRLNHLNEIKFTCPFNATHVLPYLEKDYHLLHCPNKAPLDRLLSESLDKNNPFKGRTAVPSYSEALPMKSDEIWDLEERDEPAPGYIPTKERPPGSIVEPAPFLGASAKRQLYQELHQKSESIDFKLNLNSGSSIPAPIPRQPKQPSEASKFEDKRMEEDFPCLGRGRGRIPISRIAANIYSLPATNKSSMTLNSYSSVVSNKMNNISMANDTRANTSFITGNCDASAAFNHEFPPLGLGRGKFRNDLPLAGRLRIQFELEDVKKKFP
ncbi:uncharacterized protein LOC129971441 isoform X2 [Argiope bruennichi]|uniref:uncharacterized protein LOC129971441 isoform X2 n=1 Tax=Argiope bruennichi TaxID=94029 RepID=UPI002493F12F|nr:uncharacterized protein LOC129971441 isoform X2 [Argiope bruennichi]